MAATVVPSVIVNLSDLNKHNYEYWSFRVKTYLLAEGLWKVVEGTTPEPPKPKDGEADDDQFEAWSKSNAKALHTIHISCGDKAYAFIWGINIAKVAWDTLAEVFKQSQVSNYTGHASIYANIYEPFFNNLDDKDCNWDAVMEFIKQHPEALRARSPSDGTTVLHWAVSAEKVDVVEELMHLMTDDGLELELQDNDGDTALHWVAQLEKESRAMIDVAKYMVGKNKKALAIVNSSNETPLVTAMDSLKIHLALYLFEVSPSETRDDAERMGFTFETRDLPSGRKLTKICRPDTEEERSDVHTSVDGDAKPEKELEIEQTVEGHETSNANIYTSFFANMADWQFDAVMEFIKQHPEAVRARSPSDGWIALHNAVWAGKVDVVKQLVQLMTEDDLEIQNENSETALQIALRGGDLETITEIIKCLVEKNKKILTIVNSDNETPLVRALLLKRTNIAHYLFYVSPLETREAAQRMGFTVTSLAFVDMEDKNCNWDAVMEFIRLYPEAVRAKHPSNGMTALHYAIDNEMQHVAKELVQLMTEDDLAIQDEDGDTALHGAALAENASDHMTEISKCMVEKNVKLITILNSSDETALLAAFTVGNWKLAEYLYSVTPFESIRDKDAAQIINEGIRDKKLDIPWDLIQRKPCLGITEDHTGKYTLLMLAGIPSAFLSGSRLSFWERWIYDCLYIKPTLIDGIAEPINEVCIDVQKVESDHQTNRRNPFRSVLGLFRGLVATNLLKLLGIDHLYEMKFFHVRIHQLLQSICKVIEDPDFKQIPDNLLHTAIFRAVERGPVEFVTQICRAKPDILRNITDDKYRSLLQFAAECRQEKVFSLIHGFSPLAKEVILITYDESGNNILHAVGEIPTTAQNSHIRGAALQMQRELQWFKEVESIARPLSLEAVIRDNMTPRELFTKNHRELAKEGENSMKETATSCTVVGALVITMMFAAAFTVPGGNNGDIGTPIFLDKKEFKIFMVADAISLFSSTTSVMIFLGILTSRYAEDDFLKSLPRKMILGLLTLFLSIASMMIAFSSALFLMLPRQSWIAIPATVLSSLPIASFVWMQFPFLVEIFISTYGAGPFDRNVDSWKS